MIEANAATLIVGGLLVGFGTRLGNGCTSGHGVCGLARLSPRSLAATATFMAAGFLTVFVVRHVLLKVRSMNRVSPFLAGLLFGIGLCLSGMTNASKVLAFLDLGGAWDPSLAFVMGGAVAVAFVAFRIAARRRLSLSGEPFHLPTATAIDARLVGGSLLFGAGWGLVGLCPGPAIADIGFLDRRAALFVLAMARRDGALFGPRGRSGDAGRRSRARRVRRSRRGRPGGLFSRRALARFGPRQPVRDPAMGKVRRPRLKHHLVRVAAFGKTAVELSQSLRVARQRLRSADCRAMIRSPRRRRTIRCAPWPG